MNTVRMIRYNLEKIKKVNIQEVFVRVENHVEPVLHTKSPYIEVRLIMSFTLVRILENR